MTRCLYVISLAAFLAMSGGCDIRDRMGRLEKQNEELKAEIKKSEAAADFDLQAKCGKDARVWFNQNWTRDKTTILLSYTNHYNKPLNKCFVFVEYHYKEDQNGSWTNYLTLWDMYENVKYGEAAESHTETFKPKFGITKSVYICDVLGKECKAIDEFNDLVRPYLTN
jgi:hypothetical protein